MAKNASDVPPACNSYLAKPPGKNTTIDNPLTGTPVFGYFPEIATPSIFLSQGRFIFVMASTLAQIAATDWCISGESISGRLYRQWRHYRMRLSCSTEFFDQNRPFIMNTGSAVPPIERLCFAVQTGL